MGRNNLGRNSFWSPYVAGVGLGLTLLATFCLAGWGLGASSAFSLLAGVGVEEVSPGYASTLKYFSGYLNVASPLRNWMVFEVGGLFLGALAGALLSGKFKFRFDRGARIGGAGRTVAAFAGGALIGFSSRLARGCTSGVALSGGAELAISGWIFVLAMFISGFVVAGLFFRRLWS
jgi:uncharacterized membrane protein YedE/YeeE